MAERGALSLTYIREVAARALRDAKLSQTTPDPRHIAVRLGYVILPRARGDMIPNRRLIAYSYDPDPHLLGLRVAFALASKLLEEHGSVATDTDRWHLAACLLLPTDELNRLRHPLEEPVATAPGWFVDAAVIHSIPVESIA